MTESESQEAKYYGQTFSTLYGGLHGIALEIQRLQV